MRAIFICLLVLLLGVGNLKSQNLVANPSFEEHDLCPTFLIQLYRANGWTINVNSADYFNFCATSFSQVSVPLNGNGFQYPVDGDAYAGFLAKAKNLVGQDAREYLGRELTTPLISGHRYYVSFYVSLSSLGCGINKIGIRFTNLFLGDTVILPVPLVDNFAQVYTDSIVSDTSGWTKIAGSFIADSAYHYFMIGNFFDDSHIDSLLIPDIYHSPCGNYYYVDNICVSADPITCGVEPTSSVHLTNRAIKVYPNPARDNLTIENVLEETFFQLYDYLGKKVFTTRLTTGTNTIELKYLTSGMYIYKVIGESKVGKVFIEK